MKWSDLNIWDNFKKLSGSLITKDNYILIIYFSLLYFILIFTVYPFTNFNNLNDTMQIYKYILGFVLLAFFAIFVYIFKKLDSVIAKEFYPIVVVIETILIIAFLVFIVYKNISKLESFGFGWSILNILIVIGFTLQFIILFWKCYNKTSTIICDTNLFYYWWVWAIVAGCFIALSLIFTATGLYNWTIFFNQTSVYFILFLFIFVILLNSGSITDGKLAIKSQLITPNSILQTMLKFLCIIGILFFTQVFLRFTKDNVNKNIALIPIILVIINTIPFIFNILQPWLAYIIVYPLFFLIFFAVIFIFVGGWNIFVTGYNIGIFFYNLFFHSKQSMANPMPTTELSGLFRIILFIYIFGFAIFLLLIYEKYSKETKSDAAGYDKFKEWYSSLSSWWLWTSFAICYIIISSITGSLDYLNIPQSGSISDFYSNIQNGAKIGMLLLTCGYLFILYYDIFNKKTTFTGSTDWSLYAKNIFIVLIVAVLLFSLTKYTKISGVFISIFILLAVLFIYNKLYDLLYDTLSQHISQKKCDNLQSGGIGFGFLFLFLSLIMAFWLSGKKTNPFYLFIAFLMSILGYYFGEMATTNETRYKESQNFCSDFKSTPPLGTNDSIKTIVYISVVILLFVAMNFFTRKLTNTGSYEIMIGVLFFLLLSYIVIIFKALTKVVDILHLVSSIKYFTSNVTNKWSDFLITITTFIVFMSGIGLLITTCSNKLVSDFLNSMFKFTDTFEWFSKSTFSSLIYGLSNEFKSFQENPISKTILFFLLLFYKFIQLIVIIPEKFNSIYSDIGNFVERNFLRASLTILVVEIFVICLYLLITKTYKNVKSSFIESTPLITAPTFVFPSFEKKYEELPKEQPYTFGISFSLFIEEAGSLNYFIPILSYNNNPCIMYKPSANNLIVTIPKGYANITAEKSKNLNAENTEIINSYTILNSHIGTVVDDKYIVYSTTDVKLQKWMNIFINYNNGVIDIFLNGQLANSSNINQIIPDNYSNTITFGSDNVEDTHIKINNLKFYNRDIGSDNILHINLKTYTE